MKYNHPVCRAGVYAAHDVCGRDQGRGHCQPQQGQEPRHQEHPRQGLTAIFIYIEIINHKTQLLL